MAIIPPDDPFGQQHWDQLCVPRAIKERDLSGGEANGS